MDPFSLLVLGGAAVVGLLIVASKRDKPSQSDSSHDEIRRIGNSTIDRMQRTSSDFRDHIDRETRNHR